MHDDLLHLDEFELRQMGYESGRRVPAISEDHRADLPGDYTGCSAEVAELPPRLARSIETFAHLAALKNAPRILRDAISFLIGEFNLRPDGEVRRSAELMALAKRRAEELTWSISADLLRRCLLESTGLPASVRRRIEVADYTFGLGLVPGESALRKAKRRGTSRQALLNAKKQLCSALGIAAPALPSSKKHTQQNRWRNHRGKIRTAA